MVAWFLCEAAFLETSPIGNNHISLRWASPRTCQSLVGPPGYLRAVALVSEAYSTLQGIWEIHQAFIVRKRYLIVFCAVLVLKGGGGNRILRGSCKCLLVLVSVVESLRSTELHSENCRRWRKQICVESLCLHVILNSTPCSPHIYCTHCRPLNSHCRKEACTIVLLITAGSKISICKFPVAHFFFLLYHICVKIKYIYIYV